MQLANKIGQRLERLVGRASSVCLLSGGVMIALIAVAVSYAAVRRYLFQSPPGHGPQPS